MYIYLVQEKPCLWNKESAFFKNKTKRNAAMEELCENLEKSKTIEQVKAKFHSLRTSFHRESKNPQSDWKYLRILHFLKEGVTGEECHAGHADDKWKDEEVTCLLDYYRGETFLSSKIGISPCCATKIVRSCTVS